MSKTIKTFDTFDQIELYTVMFTRNYDLIVAHAMNRVVDSADGEKDLRRLLKRMRIDGFGPIYAIHCAVDSAQQKLRIVDGHRRFHTAKQLGIPVALVAFSDGDEVSPLVFSGAQRSWNQKDFSNSHANTNEDYREVLAYCAANPGISEKAAFGMFGGEISSSTNKNDVIREGRFFIKNREHPAHVARITERILTAGNSASFARTVNCITAVSKIVATPSISLDEFEVRIAKYPQLLKQQRSTDDYLEMFERIYNYFRTGAKHPLVHEVRESMRARQVAFCNGAK